MKFERPSAGNGAKTADLLYGESNHRTDSPGDERELYGEPCHEVGNDHDEQTLYGEPQHELGDGNPELPDLELLFARTRFECSVGPTVFQSSSDSLTARSTER